MRDEVSMISQTILDMIDETLHEIFESRVPFAGKYFRFEGDFRQGHCFDKIGLIVRHRRIHDILSWT